MSDERYPFQRELDGIYIRVERNGKWENICFSDLTHDERAPFLDRMDVNGLKRTCNILADTLYGIGEQFHIMRAGEGE